MILKSVVKEAFYLMWLFPHLPQCQFCGFWMGPAFFPLFRRIHESMQVTYLVLVVNK